MSIVYFSCNVLCFTTRGAKTYDGVLGPLKEMIKNKNKNWVRKSEIFKSVKLQMFMFIDIHRFGFQSINQ